MCLLRLAPLMFQHSTSNKKAMTITECVDVCLHNCDEMVESTRDTLFFSFE